MSIPIIPTAVIDTLESFGKHPPSVINILREHDDATRVIFGNGDLNAAAIERQRLELHERTTTRLQREQEAALAATMKELDREEAAAMREARPSLKIPTDTVLRDSDKHMLEQLHGLRRDLQAQTMLSAIAVTTEPAALELAVEDAELTDNAMLARAVAGHALARFDALLATERKRRRNAGDQTLPQLEAAAQRVRHRVQQWQQEHPTPAQRLRAVREKRERLQTEHRTLFADVLKYFSNIGSRVA